nr:hypothetical protein [Chlamydiota bacterium]
MLNSSVTAYQVNRLHQELKARSCSAKVATILASATDLTAGTSAVALGVIAIVGLLTFSAALQWCLIGAGAAYTVFSLATTIQGHYNVKALLKANQEKQAALGKAQAQTGLALTEGQNTVGRVMSKKSDAESTIYRHLLDGASETAKLKEENQRLASDLTTKRSELFSAEKVVMHSRREITTLREENARLARAPEAHTDYVSHLEGLVIALPYFETQLGHAL